MAEDVYDFNALGAALVSTATDNDIVNFREREKFFNPYQRKFTNEVGRTYTALENMIVHFVNGSINLEWWTDICCRKISLSKASLQIMSLM